MTEGIGGTDRSSGTTVSDTLSREQASASHVRAQELREQLAANPQAVAALDRFVANLACYNLDDTQRVAALDSFMQAPNAATAAFLEGRIGQDLGSIRRPRTRWFRRMPAR